MIYERLDGIPFPHGAQPRLDDTLRFLDIASLAGTVDPTTIDGDMTEIERSQAIYRALHDESNGAETKFAAARNPSGAVVGAASYSLFPEHEFMQLETLAVDPEYQAQRVGTHLLDLVINHGIEAGARSIQLSATKDYAPFYIKQGFDDVDTERDCPIRLYAKIINPVDPPDTM